MMATPAAPNILMYTEMSRCRQYNSSASFFSLSSMLVSLKKSKIPSHFFSIGIHAL